MTSSATSSRRSLRGRVQTGDTGELLPETYDTKNVGTGKTLTAAGTVTDGNSGNNYTYTYVTAATGTIIIAEALTVTAAANSKTYDSTTSSATKPTVTSGTCMLNRRHGELQ